MFPRSISTRSAGGTVKGPGGHDPFPLFHIGCGKLAAGQLVQRLRVAVAEAAFRTAHIFCQRLFVVQSKAQDTFIFFYLRKPLHKKTPQIEKNRSDTPYRFDS